MQGRVGDGGSEEDLKGYFILIHCYFGDFPGSASQEWSCFHSVIDVCVLIAADCAGTVGGRTVRYFRTVVSLMKRQADVTKKINLSSAGIADGLRCAQKQGG